MRKLTRGASPATLLTAGVTEFEEARLHFEGTGREDGFDYSAYRAKDVKNALTAMSCGKCAYCEADYDATQPNDVEHFRPKGAIDTPGGRVKPGYWWLASTWSNLLPSCIRCNRRERQPLFDGTELAMGKANDFPLTNEPQRANAVGGEALEVPLLLDPCLLNPSDHVRFEDDEGRCIAKEVDPDPTSLSARRARASIDTYGLNRAGLVRERSIYMGWAKVSLARLESLARRLEMLPADAVDDCDYIGGLIETELDYLVGLTSGEGSYTGMLRAIVDPKLAELNMSL